MRAIFLRQSVLWGGIVLLALAVGCDTPVEPDAQVIPATRTVAATHAGAATPNVTHTNTPTAPAAQLLLATADSVTPTTAPAAYPPPATAYVFTGYPSTLELPPTPTNTPNHTATPRPTLTPTNTPTVTPTPTPLAMATSSYRAVWADQAPVEGLPFPEDPDTIFWIADPTDVGNKQELFRVSEPIRYMKISPDGRYIAFTTWNYVTIRSGDPGPLWLFDMHSRQQQQLLPVGSGLFSWSPDSTAIASIVGKGEGYSTAIELVKVNTGEKSLLVTAQETDPFPHFLIAGWSADGNELYYVKAAPAAEYENDYEVWRVNTDGSAVIQLLPPGYSPVYKIGIEPQTETVVLQSGFLGLFTSYYTLGQTTSLVPADQYKQTLSQQPTAGEWRDFSAVWSPNSPELIFTHTSESSPSDGSSQSIWKHNLLTEITAAIGTLEPAFGWRLLSISPDHQWLALHHQNNDPDLPDHFLFHLATGIFVPVIPTHRHQFVFLGWVENPTQ